MADHSEISWTDATWGPTLGCTKVSSGCTSCYAIRTAYRQEHAFKRADYQGLTKRLPDGSLNWTGQVNAVEARLIQPLTWRKPRRVFVDSQSDLFHERVPDDFIIRVFAVMDGARQHTFQLLTKRPERMLALLSDPAFPALVDESQQQLCNEHNWCYLGSEDWPLPNVWVGVSVEDQRAADERIPLLLQTPAAVRFLSCEPLLGPVNLEPWLPIEWSELAEEWIAAWPGVRCYERKLHWIIGGGESGPGYRPCDLDWLRTLREQCWAAEVPFWAKQPSGPRSEMPLPVDLQIRQFPAAVVPA